jgi:hypothetical protein
VKDSSPDRNDLALLAAFTVLALAAGFTGLGSRAAPRTYWTARVDEVPVADARTVATFDRLSYWVGLGEGTVAVEVSRDGTAWERIGAVEQPDSFGFMEWRILPVSVTARYLRLLATRPGLEIGEVGALAADGTRIVLAASGGPRTPFDEQHLPVRTPTARTGMYFDETYFARGAWEGLRGLSASETSHPPLGRRIIALGIALWGMNPFGWRFVGALAGALAVPLLYLVARRLDLARPWRPSPRSSSCSTSSGSSSRAWRRSTRTSCSSRCSPRGSRSRDRAPTGPCPGWSPWASPWAPVSP